MQNSIFESSTRSSGDLVAVFECDQDGGYFYLFDVTKDEGQQARAVIEVSAASVEFHASDISVHWNASEESAGLFIGGNLWAAFDQLGRSYGGNYEAQKSPRIPSEVVGRFMPSANFGAVSGQDAQAGRH